VQRNFESLYSIPLTWTVTDFLVTDTDIVKSLEGDGGFESNEKLLIHEDDEYVDLSLYIDRTVLENLRADDPLERLHDGNLSDFLVTLEGVSHFVCMAWHAQEDRSITLMELELQGEIDKFIALAMTLAEQGHRNVPSSLRRRLFGNFELRSDMTPATRTRYRDANNFARRYCRYLHHRYLNSIGSQRTKRDFRDELQHFYRLDQRSKIRTIEQAG